MLIQQSFKQSLQQRIDPKLILANNILQLSQVELQQAIEQELAENPALEVPEDDPCEGCEMPKALCVDCSVSKQREALENIDLSIHELEIPVDVVTGDEEAENDFISNIEAEITLHDHLRTQLSAVTLDEQREIGEYLISNINDSGYLSCLLSEVAEEFKVSEAEVETVLNLIQRFDPAGVGARDLQECLKLQLEHLENDNQGNSVALAMVRDHWNDMLSGKLGRIARKLRVNAKDILKAVEFVKKCLNPYPGNAFRVPWQHKSENSGNTIRPDVIVRRTPAGYEIEVIGNEQYLLAINNYYRNAYSQIKNGGAKSYSEDDRKHITEFVERADTFIKNLNQRRRTLRLITKCIIEFQQGYIETGSRAFLRPLTRTRISKALTLHESTISRATANKYVQLPSDEVVSFDFFFDSSVSVKDLIEELISQEDPHNPLSDQEIAKVLQERGLNIARRTVVKYREAQKILSSRQRRR